MQYAYSAITDAQMPHARFQSFQHIVDTYASETNKIVSVWKEFTDSDLLFRPHARSSTVLEVMKHQLLSERRFFGEFLGSPEPNPAAVLPTELSVARLTESMARLAFPRRKYLAEKDDSWWLNPSRFFDVERQRIWIFWRRVLHTAHHRTQLAVYLRLLEKPVPSIYVPTADVSCAGADPTSTVDAAGR